MAGLDSSFNQFYTSVTDLLASTPTGIEYAKKNGLKGIQEFRSSLKPDQLTLLAKVFTSFTHQDFQKENQQLQKEIKQLEKEGVSFSLPSIDEALRGISPFSLQEKFAELKASIAEGQKGVSNEEWKNALEIVESLPSDKQQLLDKICDAVTTDSVFVEYETLSQRLVSLKQASLQKTIDELKSQVRDLEEENRQLKALVPTIDGLADTTIELLDRLEVKRDEKEFMIRLLDIIEEKHIVETTALLGEIKELREKLAGGPDSSSTSADTDSDDGQPEP